MIVFAKSKQLFLRKLLELQMVSLQKRLFVDDAQILIVNNLNLDLFGINIIYSKY
jgi:hypothetical protein